MIWGIIAGTGFCLWIWSIQANPEGSYTFPGHATAKKATGGPYRFMRHPLYAGTWLQVVGYAGLAAGFWNALVAGILADLILEEFTAREVLPRDQK